MILYGQFNAQVYMDDEGEIRTAVYYAGADDEDEPRTLIDGPGSVFKVWRDIEEDLALSDFQLWGEIPVDDDDC